MGAWGIKALERDEGLDVLDILKNEYVPEHPVMDLGEMIELMKEEVMLGADFSQIDFLFDNTAMALAELYFQWKDNGKLDYDHEEAIWDKVTGFTASKEALAFLLRQLTDIKNEVPDEDGIREIVDLWKNEDSGEIAPAWLEHLNQLIDRLDSEQEARQMYIKKYWGNFIGGSAHHFFNRKGGVLFYPINGPKSYPSSITFFTAPFQKRKPASVTSLGYI